LQVPARFRGVFAQRRRIALTVGAQHHVRLDAQGPFGETAVARIAERNGVMAAITSLWIVQSLDRVQGDEIAAVAFGQVIPTEAALRKGIRRTATFVAIKTPLLVVALVAVVAGTTGQNPVPPQEISIVVGRDSLRLMAGIAFPDRHLFVFGVGCFLVSIRLLLEAD